MTAPICVVHSIPGLDSQDGGPSRSAVRLADFLALNRGLSVQLVFHSVAGRTSIQSSTAAVRRRTVTSGNRLAVKLGLIDRRLLVDAFAADKVDLLHTHSIWHPSNYWATRIASRYGVPVICQPRGMLDQWSMSRHALRKRLALLLFQQRDLDRAAAFIATSPMEVEGLRRNGIRQPVAMIPNGVDIPALPTAAVTRKDVPDRERIMLFLSRIHPKKGLLNLIEAWSRCRTPGWRLLLAGPDEAGHLGDVMQRAKQLKVTGLDYVGELEGEAKAAMYASADVFVLPSFSENFGLVVPEALSFGTPVITTRATPWGELTAYRCGWWIETGAEPLAHAMREAMALSDDEREEMGKRGRALAARYQWSHAAQQTAELYRWLLGRGDRPGCLVADQ